MPVQLDSAGFDPDLPLDQIHRIPLHAQHPRPAQTAQCQPPGSGPLILISDGPELEQLLRIVRRHALIFPLHQLQTTN